MSASPAYKHYLKRTATTAGYSGGSGGQRGRGSAIGRGRGRGRGGRGGRGRASTSAQQVLFSQGFLRGTGQQLSKFSRGAECKQISEGSDDTRPLEDVPANVYHNNTPTGLHSGGYVLGSSSQHLLIPDKVYITTTAAGQASAANVQTPDNLQVAGKAYQVRKLTLRFLIDFSEMSTLPPGAFRFRVVSGYITNNAFDGASYGGFQAHASGIINKYFDHSKKFGGLGISGELKVISDKVHQVVPLVAQGGTSGNTNGKVAYAAINGFVDFSKYVSGTKRLRINQGTPAGDGNMVIDNSRTNSAARIPFLLVQNLDGMEGTDSGGKSPQLSYFWAKQFVDY